MPAGPTPSSGQGPDAETAPSSSSSLQTGWGGHIHTNTNHSIQRYPLDSCTNHSVRTSEAKGSSGSSGSPLCPCDCPLSEWEPLNAREQLLLWLSLPFQIWSHNLSSACLLCPSLYITCTYTHTYTGSGSPCLKAAGEIRSGGVFVCWSHFSVYGDGRGVCNGSALSSLHSSLLVEGYVKRQTCCCSLQQRLASGGCTSISRRHAAHVQWLFFLENTSEKLCLCSEACKLDPFVRTDTNGGKFKIKPLKRWNIMKATCYICH